MNVTSQIKQPIFKKWNFWKKSSTIDDFTSGFVEQNTYMNRKEQMRYVRFLTAKMVSAGCERKNVSLDLCDWANSYCFGSWWRSGW
jgi:hypothetical protein